jgi:hypothetical protein
VLSCCACSPYRVQANAFGDLDRETLRTLERIARAHRAGERKPVPAAPDPRTLKPGTVLLREHDGHMQAVTVMPDGFAWRGTTYSSLSKVALAITGTHWNGPRFFGLRDRAPRGGSEGRSGGGA